MKDFTQLKAGMAVITPYGMGMVTHFEVYPPLRPGLHGPPKLLPEVPEDSPEGTFARAGVISLYGSENVTYWTANKLELCDQPQ